MASREMTGFFSGVVNQLNSNYDANKKIQEDRDRRREEQADQLKTYMQKSDYDNVLAKGRFDYESTRKEELDINKENRGLDLYKQQKGIDLGASKDLERFKTDEDIRKSGATDNSQAIINSIQGLIGDTTQDKGIGGLYKAKSASELLQANRPTEKIGKAMADSLNTKIQYEQTKGKYAGKPLEFAGGDAYKELDDIVKAATRNNSTTARSPFYGDTSGIKVKDTGHTEALGQAQQVLSALGNMTRTTDESIGSTTNMSKLSPSQASSAAVAMVRSKNIILDPQSTPEAKKAAATDFDRALKLSAGGDPSSLINRPDVATVFDQNFRDVYNQFATGASTAKQPSASTPAVGTPSQADLEFTAQKHGITVDQVKQRLGIQ